MTVSPAQLLMVDDRRAENADGACTPAHRDSRVPSSSHSRQSAISTSRFVTTRSMRQTLPVARRYSARSSNLRRLTPNRPASPSGRRRSALPGRRRPPESTARRPRRPPGTSSNSVLKGRCGALGKVRCISTSLSRCREDWQRARPRDSWARSVDQWLVVEVGDGPTSWPRRLVRKGPFRAGRRPGRRRGLGLRPTAETLGALFANSAQPCRDGRQSSRSID